MMVSNLDPCRLSGRTLVPTSSPDLTPQRANVEKPTWRDFYWYHCIDLGNGIVTDGDYDMTQYLAHYGFPDDLHGKRVLDVGRASGFFSFEFERRGADVTATEI